MHYSCGANRNNKIDQYSVPLNWNAFIILWHLSCPKDPLWNSRTYCLGLIVESCLLSDSVTNHLESTRRVSIADYERQSFRLNDREKSIGILHIVGRARSLGDIINLIGNWFHRQQQEQFSILFPSLFYSLPTRYPHTVCIRILSIQNILWQFLFEPSDTTTGTCIFID